jgi:hypothetical protein
MKHGQQVAEVGVPPLPQKNSKEEARLRCAGFFVFLGLTRWLWAAVIMGESQRGELLHPTRHCDCLPWRRKPLPANPWQLSSSLDGPWHPMIPLYRPHPLARIRPRKPLPGQMCLPGMELVDVERPCSPTSGTEAVCPNCGGTEFDEDGDCTACWEPGVVEPRNRM